MILKGSSKQISKANRPPQHLCLSVLSPYLLHLSNISFTNINALNKIGDKGYSW